MTDHINVGGIAVHNVNYAIEKLTGILAKCDLGDLAVHQAGRIKVEAGTRGCSITADYQLFSEIVRDTGAAVSVDEVDLRGNLSLSATVKGLRIRSSRAVERRLIDTDGKIHTYYRNF